VSSMDGTVGRVTVETIPERPYIVEIDLEVLKLIVRAQNTVSVISVSTDKDQCIH